MCLSLKSPAILFDMLWLNIASGCSDYELGVAIRFSGLGAGVTAVMGVRFLDLEADLGEGLGK